MKSEFLSCFFFFGILVVLSDNFFTQTYVILYDENGTEIRSFFTGYFPILRSRYSNIEVFIS